MDVTIFDYSDCVDYLTAVLERKKRQNPSYSLRAWARQLKIANPGQLSLVLNRKRKISPSLGRKLRNALSLSPEEVPYFDLLVLATNAQTLRERRYYLASMESFRPERRHQDLEADLIHALTSWYHVVIMEMTYLDDFEPNPEWIASRIKFGVTVEQVSSALAHLLRVGLLEWTESGKLVKSRRDIKIPDDIPLLSLRLMHKQYIGNAVTALMGESIGERNITAHVIATSRDKLEKAKEMIRQFRFDLARFLDEDGPCDSVVSLNVQLFDNVQTIRKEASH